MARTAQITDGGSRTVNIINTGATGFIPTRGGFGSSSYSPHQLLAARQLDDMLFVERWQLVLKGSSVDNLASQSDDLIDLLRDAYRYFNDPVQRTPIYLQMQLTGETNARYATVYMSPEISNPDFFDGTVEVEYLIETMGVNIARFAWESAAPGSAGSALTLTATDGPASPTKVHIANFRDDANITHKKNHDDSAGTYADITTGSTLFSSPVAQNDAIYIGSTDQPIKNIVIPKLGTAGNLTTTTLKLYYYSGTWDELTLGTDYTIYPGADFEESFEQNTDDIVINIKPPSDWTTVAVDGATAYWIEIRETNASPSYSQNPVANSSDDFYAQRKDYIEFANTILKGNEKAKCRLVMKAPYGGDENEGFANHSRILAFARSQSLGANQFVPTLNAGNQDNPTNVTCTAGTDASFDADPTAPGGTRCTVDFSGDETLVKRLTYTLTNKLEYYIGEFRPFLVCQQIGGSAGDLEIMLRVLIGSTDAYAPKLDTDEIPTEGADQGKELLELGIYNPGGTIKIPFGRIENADSLSNINLYFEIHAKRTTGSATLRIYELFLGAVDELSIDYEDPVSDSVSGGSALRGDTGLEDDSGVIADRTFKFINATSAPVLAETWTRGGKPPMFEPATHYRVYFKQAHFPAGGTWGTGPLIASYGMHLTFEMYAHNIYYALRGSG